MNEEPQVVRGDAAWKAQRDDVARRNDVARKRAQAEQQSRDSVIELRVREQTRREKDQLQALNARLDKQRARGPR